MSSHCARVVAGSLVLLAATLGPSVAAADRLAAPLNVVIFWSVACGNCKDLMSELDRVRKKFTGPAVRFYAASVDDPETTPAALDRRLGLEPLANGGELAARYDVSAIPWVLLLDCRGEVVTVPSRDNPPAVVAGYVEMELVLRRQIARDLAQARGAAGHAVSATACSPPSSAT